jgi:transcriptional regulator with XRE-family HTH domain
VTFLEIYNRIKLRREAINMSQDELAIKAGYKTRSSISKIEDGKTDLPQSKIESIAKALRTTPAYLMGWTDDPVNYEDPDIISNISPDILEHFNGNAEKAYKAQEKIYEDGARESCDNLNILDKDDALVILNRNARKLSKEDREKLLDMARLMFKEEFND